MTQIFKPVSQVNIKVGDTVLWSYGGNTTKHEVLFFEQLLDDDWLFSDEYRMNLSDYGMGIFGDYNGEFCVVQD